MIGPDKDKTMILSAFQKAVSQSRGLAGINIASMGNH